MTHLNVEIKAKCRHPDRTRAYLHNATAAFKGIDYQIDTYFNVARGRLKLRQGNIENNLIYYDRRDEPGVKQSKFQLVNIPDANAIKEVLTKSIGIKVVIEKKREIYFIRNVKFHIDEVSGLGNFVEIEASNLYEDVSSEELQGQCSFYMKELEIMDQDLIAASYSDMLLASENTSTR